MTFGFSLAFVCVPVWISDSQREKAGTNHNQAYDDNDQKAGRSKIFAHDDSTVVW